MLKNKFINLLLTFILFSLYINAQTVYYTCNDSLELQYINGAIPTNVDIMVIDFGDSNIDTISGEFASHKYSSNGNYTLNGKIYYTYFEPNCLCYSLDSDYISKTITIPSFNSLSNPPFMMSKNLTSVYCYGVLSQSEFSLNNFIQTIDFGDGTVVINPNYNQSFHTYSNSGNYTICRTISGTNKCTNQLYSYTICDTANFSICNLNSNFNYSTIYKSVNFYNISTQNDCFNINYLWDFGDGNTDTTSNPIHVYLNDSLYIVKLFSTATDSTGGLTLKDSVIKSVKILTPLNMNNISKNINYTIYPNPIERYFEIKFNDYQINKNKIEIYNLLGIKIFEKNNIVNNQIIDLDKLPKGTYLIKILDNKNMFSYQKIVKN